MDIKIKDTQLLTESDSALVDYDSLTMPPADLPGTDATFPSPHNSPSVYSFIEDSESAETLVAGGGYLHNHSLVNRIQVENNSSATFAIINDFTSNGSLSGQEKQVDILVPGEQTHQDADVDVILPLDESTRFILGGGQITEPGAALRTSRRGDVTITDGPEPNVFHVRIEGGLAPINGTISEIDDPGDDESSPFHKLLNNNNY